MSARQTKKRKGRNNRERTVTTFTEDPNTSFLVPLSSEDQPPFMNYQNYQQQFFQPILPPGKNDLEILENLKSIIKDGQHEFYRAVPQPAALASLYMGPQPDHTLQEYPTPRDSVDNPNGDNVDSAVDTSPVPDVLEPPPPVKPDLEDVVQPQPDTNADSKGEYPAPADTPNPMSVKDEQPEPTWERRTLDATNDRNPSPARTAYDSRPLNGATDARSEDNHFYDKDRDRDRDGRFIDRDRDRDWERDRDRHDTRDRGRDRDRRTEFFGRSYGRSHAPRPPPELRHYEPSYGADYVPPPRRFDPDDRRGGPRGASLDDRFKPPFDDRKPPFEDRRLPPADDRRLALDDRSMRPLPNSRPTPTADDRARPADEAVPLVRIEDDRGSRVTSLAADDRPRVTVPLEERLSQAAAPSLQDRLSQPTNVPTRVDMPAPTLEERLSLGPAPRYRAPSVARDDLRLAKDDVRDHDRLPNFRRDLSRERPQLTASSYRPDSDRFGERDERERRDRDVDEPARIEFGRPARRYSPPPAMDRDRERERARPFYPTRSPPPMREYPPDSDRRYASERERDAFERRRDWYTEDDKRGVPTQAWRPPERTFVDRERFDRERERDGRAREREGALAPPAPPTRAQWDERDRRLPMSLPPARIDATDGPRSLSARLTDAYPPPPPAGDDRAYGQREFERGRYAGMDDRGPSQAPPFSRVRNRSPTPPRRGPLAEDLRPPLKRVREDTGYAGGAAYSPPRREYAPGPPPSSTATSGSVATPMSGTVPPRLSGTRTPPNAGGAFYDRDREREREREREYARGEWYDRGRRSPPRMGPGYARMGRDERRYVPPPRTS